MTDFFVQQEKAKRNTGLLVVLVVLAVLSIVAFLYAISCLLYLYITADDLTAITTEVYRRFFYSFQILPWTAGITLFVIFITSLCKILELSEDGASIANSLHAREIPPSTLDPREKRLRNVVEEMAIAAGIRVPRVFLLDDEWGLNAFAAGNSPSDATVIVTKGLLCTLTREELQAVIGHEFSHILNGDMRRNIRLIGLLAGIFCLSQMGIVLLRVVLYSGNASSSGRNDSRNGGNSASAMILVLFALGAALYVIGAVGYFFGRVIQSAISRQREYLADASSVQFTRNPAALASALKCIGASKYGSHLRLNSLEIAHMCFVPPRSALFDTHPPLEARILRLDAAFQGDFGPARNPSRRRSAASPAPRVKKQGAFEGFHHSNGRASVWGALLLTDVYYNTDDPIYVALHQPVSALAFLLEATFTGTDPAYRPRMLEIALCSPLGEWADGTSCLPEELLSEWERKIARWEPYKLRAGCELATDALRSQSPEVRERIFNAVSAISDLDSYRTPFELALTALLCRRLRDPSPRNADLFVSAAQLKNEAVVVFTVLCAYAGDEQARAGAWKAVEQAYPPVKGMKPSEAGLESARALDRALTALRRLTYLWKGQFMAACRAAVEQDGQITQDEEDLLRAIEDGIRA